MKTGDSLGDATYELNGNYINNWCGSGPKSYAYTTSNAKIMCKVKGFTQIMKTVRASIKRV